MKEKVTGTMVKYTIIANDYQESTQLVNKISKLLQENQLKEDLSNPQYVFIIGGDGTLLRAVNKFQDIIDKVFLL